MLLSQWGRAAAQIVSLVVLARLLEPSDYGLLAMTAAITGLALAIGDFGLSLAAIRASTLTPGQRSNLFWLNAALGLAGAGLIAMASPWIATFYGEPRLGPVAVALALVFLVNGCSVQFLVELNRAGRFGAIGGIQLVAQLGAVGGAIAAATAGAGYWALVVQQLISVVVILLGSAATARWRPGLPSRSADIRPLLRFGGGSLASQLLAYVTSNLDSVLLGRQFAASVLGLYNRAFTVAMLPVAQVLDPLTRVVMPRLAACPDDASFQTALTRVARIVTVIVAAPLSLLIACGPQLLGVVLGPEWIEAGRVMRVLACAALFQSANYLYYWAFMARGRTGLLFLSEVPGKAVLVVLLVILVPFGPTAAAWAVTIGGAAGLIGAFVGARSISLKNAALASSVGPPLLVFALAGGAAFLYATCIDTGADAPLALLSGAAAWCVVVAPGVLVIPSLRRPALAAVGRASARIRLRSASDGRA